MASRLLEDTDCGKRSAKIYRGLTSCAKVPTGDGRCHYIRLYCESKKSNCLNDVLGQAGARVRGWFDGSPPRLARIDQLPPDTLIKVLPYPDCVAYVTTSKIGATDNGH